MELIETLRTVFLAVLQGIGEFLPISSSGHLNVFQTLLGDDPQALEQGKYMTFGILLHAGTLLSILIVFWRQILDVLTKRRRVILLIIVGTIPAVICGFAIKKIDCLNFLESNLLLTGFCFLVTAIALYKTMGPNAFAKEEKLALENSMPAEYIPTSENTASKNMNKTVFKTLDTMTFTDALFIGLFQAIAILPGISRSGFTICASLLRRIRREDAAVFSFLLAIPVIAGAAFLEIIELIQNFQNGTVDKAEQIAEIPYYGLGIFLSCVVGIFSLIYLMKWLTKGKLYLFSYWLIVLGTAVIAWQLFEYF